MYYIDIIFLFYKQYLSIIYSILNIFTINIAYIQTARDVYAVFTDYDVVIIIKNFLELLKTFKLKV